MPKKDSLENLADQVLDGNKDAEKELMMAIPKNMAYDDEDNLMSPKDIAASIISSSEEPPPRVPTGVIGIDKPTRRESPYEYRQEGREQVKEGEAQILAENISLLKRRSDMQDVLLKIAAEDKDLAEKTGQALMLGGMTLTGAALGALPMLRTSYRPPVDSLAETLTGAAMGATIGGTGGAVAPLPLLIKDKAAKKEREAKEKSIDIELSPEAQKVYDEYKSKGFSPTLKDYELPE
jgi:hypothetical protein